MCFTEKHASDTSFQRIEENHPDWKSIHHPSAEHGLTICCNIAIQKGSY